MGCSKTALEFRRIVGYATEVLSSNMLLYERLHLL